MAAGRLMIHGLSGSGIGGDVVGAGNEALWANGEHSVPNRTKRGVRQSSIRSLTSVLVKTDPAVRTCDDPCFPPLNSLCFGVG